jgi:hypothetical protein
MSTGTSLGTFDPDEYRNRVEFIAAFAGYLTSGGDAANVSATSSAAMLDLDNNACPQCLIYLAVLAFGGGYATYEGEGNLWEGLEEIGRGEDLISTLVGDATSEAFAFASDNFPQQTAQFLAAMENVGAGADVAVSFIDDATGNVISGTWNSLSPEMQDRIRGGAAIATFTIPAGVAGRIGSAMPSLPVIDPLREPTGFLGSRGYPLENPVFQPARNVPEVIGDRTFTGHALDQMQNRGITPSVVEDAISPSNLVGAENRPGTNIYYSGTNGVRVITNSNGDVVTVITAARQ